MKESVLKMMKSMGLVFANILMEMNIRESSKMDIDMEKVIIYYIIITMVGVIFNTNRRIMRGNWVYDSFKGFSNVILNNSNIFCYCVGNETKGQATIV